MRIRHPLVLASVCLGYFMAVLDSTVVNVALPDMARSLGTGIAGMQWVVDGYALLFASLLLTAGALGDRLGNRAMFVAGLAVFTLASALCGIAPSLGALVAVVAGVWFYLGARRAAHPTLPPALSRDATFSAANAVGAILSFGFYGQLFLMSLFFQQVQHRSSLATGLALLPETAVISLMN